MKRRGIRMRRSFSNVKQQSPGSFSDGVSLGVLITIGIPTFLLAAAALLLMLK